MESGGVHLTPWLYDGKPFTSIDTAPCNAIGFVYEISFTNGKLYIGKKHLWRFERLPLLKSGKLRPDSLKIVRVRQKNGRYVKKELVRRESDWKTYKGSCLECAKQTPRTRTILEFAKSEAELTYLEAMWLFRKDVLRNSQYYNDNIDGRYYRKWLTSITKDM